MNIKLTSCIPYMQGMPCIYILLITLIFSSCGDHDNDLPASTGREITFVVPDLAQDQEDITRAANPFKTQWVEGDKVYISIWFSGSGTSGTYDRVIAQYTAGGWVFSKKIIAPEGTNVRMEVVAQYNGNIPVGELVTEDDIMYHTEEYNHIPDVVILGMFEHLYSHITITDLTEGDVVTFANAEHTGLADFKSHIHPVPAAPVTADVNGNATLYAIFFDEPEFTVTYAAGGTRTFIFKSRVAPGRHHTYRCGGGSAQNLEELERLLAWAKRTREGGNEDFTLKADIDLSGIEWKPIGMGDPFDGIFDGNNHVITGLKTMDEYGGLFDAITGTVQNLHLAGVSLIADSRAGGIATNNLGLIHNCSVSGEITAGTEGTGGIAGNNMGTITHCYSLARKVEASERIGGIAGINIDAVSGVITSCHWLLNAEGEPANAVGDNRASEPNDCHGHATSDAIYRAAEAANLGVNLETIHAKYIK